MIRSGSAFLPIFTLLASAASAFGQAPDGGAKPSSSGPQPGSARQAERREIFCSSLKTGQLCPESTAGILGLKGPQAEAWKVIVRKYNQSADAAAAQLQKDSAHKLTPEAMEVLKAWFAVGWNEQINAMLHQRNLDDLSQAQTQGLSTQKPEEPDAH